MIHLHVRNADGTPSQSTQLFARPSTRIRAKTDVIVQTSTGGAVGMSVDERAGPLACRPEMATLNCGTLNFGDDVFVNTRPQIRDLAARIRAAGSMPELECYEVGHIDEALALSPKGCSRRRSIFSSCWACPAASARARTIIRFMAAQIPRGVHVGRRGGRAPPEADDRARACASAGTRASGSRTTSICPKGVLAEGSAPLVRQAAAFARSIGRNRRPGRARALLVSREGRERESREPAK